MLRSHFPIYRFAILSIFSLIKYNIIPQKHSLTRNMANKYIHN